MDDGSAGKREGMGRVEAGASQEWKDLVVSIIELVAKELAIFTTDDVVEAMEKLGVPEHTENRIYGPLMVRAAKLGYCEKTKAYPESQPSRRPLLHRQPQQRWVSLIFSKDLM